MSDQRSRIAQVIQQMRPSENVEDRRPDYRWWHEPWARAINPFDYSELMNRSRRHVYGDPRYYGDVPPESEMAQAAGIADIERRR